MAERELIVERLMDAPIAAVWQAWDEHLTEWWCPKPWITQIIEMDKRPGGRSAMIMRGPNGEEAPQEGMFLEFTPAKRVVFTDALTQGWNPAGPFMVGIMEFEPEDDKTRYRGIARHWTDEAYEQHKAMGFEAGWGAVAVQLEEVAKRLA